MSARIKLISVVLVLVASILACSLLPGGTPQPAGDVISTVVAATLQALTPGAAGSPATVTATATASEAPSLLPHDLYYQTKDGAGHLQVFRLARDGATVTQVTSEPADVDNYDISPVDGRVAYVSNNQLLVAAADGSGRRLLVDGGDAQYEFNLTILNPRWSPDGWQIAPDDPSTGSGQALPALTETLRLALCDAARLRRMGAESYRIVSEEINIERMVGGFMEVLNSLKA